MKIRRYNESSEINIFTDINILHELLQDYKDDGYKYEVYPKYFMYMPSEKYFIPISKEAYNKDEERCYIGYQISFNGFYDDKKIICCTNQQRGDDRRIFYVPDDSISRFIEITKYIQGRIESMGYIFMLSTFNDIKFDVMIIEDIK